MSERIEVGVIDAGRDSGAPFDTGLTINAAMVAAGAVIDLNQHPAEQVLVFLQNNDEDVPEGRSAGFLTATFKAGVSPIASTAGSGDLEVAVDPYGAQVVVNLATAARFAQADNTVHVDFAFDNEDEVAVGAIQVVHKRRSENYLRLPLTGGL